MSVHLLAPDREAPGVCRNMIWSYPKYLAFRENQRVFTSTAIFMENEWNVTGSTLPERVPGEFVESTYLPTLGVASQVGRNFLPDETAGPGSPPMVMLGYGFWQRRFGGDPNVVGQSLGLDGISHTIVGVLPPAFRGLSGRAEVLVPVTTQSAGALGEAWNHSYRLVARRQKDVTPAQAEAATRTIGAQVHARYMAPPGHVNAPGDVWSATAVPLNDERIDPLFRRSVLILLAVAASVLLIVCVNLANLMLARGLDRQREVAIRLALGASGLRIVRQLMTESLLLAMLGAAAGVAVAYGAITAAAALLPDLRVVLPIQTAGLTRVGLSMLSLDRTTLLFTFSIAAATAVLFGLGPAWHVSRRDLTEAIKAGSSSVASRGTSILSARSLLIVGEIAIALVLLTAGGLMLRSVARLQATELGFRPDSLVSFRLALAPPKYDRPRATQFLTGAVERLKAQSGVQSVAFGSCAPVSGWCNGTTATFPGRPPAAPGTSPAVGVYWASPEFFETLGIRLVRGRLFDARDRIDQPKVVLINETAARSFWGAEDPVGKRIGVGQGGFGEGAEIVGVVADVRYGAVEAAIRPDVYLPLLQSGRSLGVIFVKTQLPPENVVPLLRREIQALDSDLPLIDVKTMDQRFSDATWRTRTSAWLLGAFAALALGLAAVGTYGVMSQGVAQRSREIGVRLALGATRSDIFQLILGRTVLLAVAGVALGIALALPSMRLLTALLYQVTPGDPVVLTPLAVTLLVVAVLAGYVPARRAMRVDPLTTLKAE
jgi:putative ABC transport system permease protein